MDVMSQMLPDCYYGRTAVWICFYPTESGARSAAGLLLPYPPQDPTFASWGSANAYSWLALRMVLPVVTPCSVHTLTGRPSGAVRAVGAAFVTSHAGTRWLPEIVLHTLLFC
jgi:hypothetical protein